MAKITEKYIGKYRVLEEIGRGKFSTVYRAENPLLMREVAIKQMNTELFPDSKSIELFFDQIRPVISFSHENTISIFDFVSDLSSPVFVMEYMSSGNLHNYLKNNPDLSYGRITELLLSAANTIDKLHKQGFIHGDIKPENFLIDKNGLLKLSDIGLLKALEISTASNKENIKNTPEYTSPEIAEGGDANAFSDQYSLGIIAFELLCGKLPFEGETSLAVLLKQIRQLPPPTETINPVLSPKFNIIFQRALAKIPTDRYPDCQTFINEIKLEIDNLEKYEINILLENINKLISNFDFKTARPFIDKARKISSDPDVLQNLSNIITKNDNADTLYLSSSQSLKYTKTKLNLFKNNFPAYPDRNLIFNKITPPPLPIFKIFWKNFHKSIFIAISIILFGFFLSISSLAFTNYSSMGLAQKATLISYSRTSTPLPPTVTPTVTLTPTITSTVTLTPTQSPIPTYVIGSIFYRKQDGMKMAFVPAGSFKMGSKEGQEDELPVHKIYLTDYWIDTTEITNNMYTKCVIKGICTAPVSDSSFTRNNYYSDSQYAEYPVINIDWEQAVTYCKWTGSRLPTEAEWEKAARGNDERTFPMGEDIDPRLANYFGGTGDTSSVGSFPLGKSPYGAFDMAGNVWEWVSSQYKPYPYDSKDGREDLTGSNTRVLRGGSWYYHFDLARTTYRYWDTPTRTNFDIGFRCAQDINK